MPTRVPPGMNNPLLQARQGFDRPNPFRPWTPNMPESPSLDRLVGLAKGAQAGLYSAMQPPPPPPERPAQPTIRWSPSANSFYVQGEQFEGRDATRALETAGLLDQPAAPEPEGGDWMPVPRDQYEAYLHSIENPTRGRLFSQNFEMGVDQLKQLGGSALQAVGAEQTGARIVKRATDRIQQVAPYQREFTGIREGGEGAVLDWFVSVLGNQGPMILQSVVAAMTGAGLGYLAIRGGVAVANAGMVGKAAAAMGRKEYADKVLAAAAKYRAGTALEAGERAILRQAAGFTGAVAGAYGSAAAIGTGDIYGEMREQGVAGVDEWGPRIKAIGMSLPYALLETITEFFIAKRLLGAGGRAKADWGKGAVAKTGEFLRRGATGVAVYGTGEALTEGAQEILVMGMSGQSLTDDAAIERYINGMAAGFAIGGILGGPSNLRSKYEPASLLNKKEEPGTDVQGEPPPAGPVNPLVPVGEPVRTEGPHIGEGRQGVLPFAEFGRASRRELSRAGDRTAAPQDVWNPQTQRYEQANADPNLPAVVPPVDPNAPVQGAFDFATPEAPLGQQFGQPTGPTQVEQAFTQAQVQNAFLQAKQEQAALKEDQLGRMENIGAANRQIDILDNEQGPTDPPPPPPAAPAGPTQPNQLPLFNQRETPRPSRADRLRRGMDVSQQRDQELVQQGRDTARDIALDAQQKGAQTSMFTRQGEPTVASLKSAGERLRKPQPVVEPSEPQTRPSRQTTASKRYVSAAKELGYSGKDFELEQIGMAAERAEVDWSHYEASQDPNFKGEINQAQVDAVKAVFAYSDITPTEYATVQAYTEGMRGEFPDVKWAEPKPEPEPPKPKAKKPLKKAAEAKPKSPAGERLKKKAAAKKAAKEKADADKKRSAAKVAESKQAEAGKGVREQDTGKPEAAGKSRAETGKKQAAVQQRKPVQIVAKDAEERWYDNYDTPYERIPADLRKEWEGAFAEGKATGELAESIHKRIKFTGQETWQTAAAAAEEYLPYDQLTPESQQIWEAAVAEDAATPALAGEIVGGMNITAKQELLADINAMELARDDMALFTEHSNNVVTRAYFDFDSNTAGNKQGLRTLALQALQELQFTPEQRAVLNRQFLDQANSGTQRSAINKAGQPQPWFAYALSTGQMQKIRRIKLVGLDLDTAKQLYEAGTITVDNMPDSTAKKLGLAVSTVSETRKLDNIEPGVQLQHLIDDTNDSTASLTLEVRSDRLEKLEVLWEAAQAKKQGNLKTRRKFPISDFFDADGKPHYTVVNGRLQLLTEAPTLAMQALREKAERELQAAKKGEKPAPLVDRDDSGEVDPDVATAEKAGAKLKRGKKTAADTDPVHIPEHTYEEWSRGGKDPKSGRFATTDGTPINGPLPRLKLKQVLSNFIKRAFMRPKFWIYKNVADLKARNPELYKEAKAARELVRIAVTKFTVRDLKNKRVTVYVNPTAEQLKAADLKSLRFIMDDRGDYYVWDGKVSVHDWMIDPIQKEGAVIADIYKTRGEGGIHYSRITDEFLVADDKKRAKTQYSPPSNVTNDFDTVKAAGYSFGWVGQARPEIDEKRRTILKGIGGAVVAAKTPLVPNKLTGMTLDEKMGALFKHMRQEQVRFYKWLYDWNPLLANDQQLHDEQLLWNHTYENVTKAISELGDGYTEIWRTAMWDGDILIEDSLTPSVKKILQPMIERDGLDAFHAISDAANRTIDVATKLRADIYADKATDRLKSKGKDKLKQGRKEAVDTNEANVILFSDYLYTKQQAAFVIAHETMGHFGLRGFIPQDKFDGIMSGIYRDNPAIRQDVDAAMNANKKLGLAEAVEEHLSDYAATLDTSIIARIWNALKNVLNDMGMKFGDESMRYLVHQARRYVREGKTANAFELQQVFDKLYEVEYGTTLPTTGRFSLTTPGMMDPQFADDMRLFGNPNIVDRSVESFEDGMKELRKMKLNFSESWDKFKARFFSLSNFRALSNPGLYTVVSLLEGMRNMSHSIKTIMNETLKPVMNKAIAGAIGGISKEQTATISNMLYHGRDWAIAQLRDNPKLTQDDKPLMYFDENGVLQRALSADGKSTLINELGAAGTITFEMMKKGFSYTIIDPDGEGTKKTKIKVPGVKNLTKTSLEWTGYKMLRDAVTEVETLLLIAQYIDASEVRKSAVNEVASLMVNERLTRADRDYIKLVMDTYRDIKVEAEVYDAQGIPTFNKDASDAAYKFIELLNKAVIGQKTDRIADLSKFMKENPNYFKGKLPDDIMSGLDKFRERVSVTENSENKFVLQDKIKAVVLSELARNRHDKATRTSIIAGYTPILREGKAQVRLLAVDAETGQPVRLAQSYRDRLIYSMFDNPADAKEMADYLNSQLRVDKEGNPKTYEALAYNHELRKETMRKVRLVAVAEQAKTNLSAPPQLNLNEFIRGLHFFDLQISPVKMEHIITTMTTQNSKMRQRLQYSGNPGFDRTSGIAAIARHIESRASTIAKTMYRSRTADAMNMRLRSTQQMWYATEQVDVRDPVTGKVDTIPKVEHLKNIMDKMFADPDAPFAAKRVAQQEYLRYKFMVDQTNKHDLKQGNKFYNEAAETLAFLDNNESIEESNFASGKTISRIRAFTSMAQLGMSLATGSLNLIALGTNSLPYLASMNRETGFGGGFGMGPSVAAMNTAMAQVGAPGMNPVTEGGRNYNLAQFYAEIAGDTRNIADPEEVARIKAGAAKLQAKYGLQAHEAQFLADEIRAGVMIPALSNSLVGQARGLAQSGIQQHFIDKWMMFFNLTEQASRRTLGLAAYRLQYAQQIAAMQEAGKDLTAEQIAIAQQQAKRFAVDAIQHTLGEYSVLNRPPVWRGGVQSLMYMYKVFPTTSIQLLRRMSKGGQAAMLASLWIMGGLMATPFAEDIEDLIDTLGQALGWKKGGARFEIAKALDEFVPGLSPWALGGLVNSFMTGNVGSRTSLGDFWPGSGVLLAGSDVGRELIDIGGPIPSALLGVGRTLADLARWPTSPTPGRSFLNIMREAPVTMARAAGDAYTYAQSGVITDKRGYVVSKDVTKMTIAARLMGFYPVAASQQYDIIRMAKRMTDYQKDTVAGFRMLWIQAYASGDMASVRAVDNAVADWNRATRGTGMEMKNFRANSMRAYRESRQEGVDRLRKGAPRAAQGDIDRMQDLATYND